VLGDVGAIMMSKRCVPDVEGPAWAVRTQGLTSKQTEERYPMAAMKPRTGDGPLEVTKEGRGIVLRMPIEGGGRLVVEMTPDEAAALGEAIRSCPGVV
jgi:hypothetical protein